MAKIIICVYNLTFSCPPNRAASAFAWRKLLNKRRKFKNIQPMKTANMKTAGELFFLNYFVLVFQPAKTANMKTAGEF
jgi:hypothetical protein